MDTEALLDRARDGDRTALARLLSLVERGGEPGRAIGRLAHRSPGSAHTIGITGPPGAGKSTLTSALVQVMRAAGHRVAVLAVDPSSPFTGGAILGDRVRMGGHALDNDVFIRSMASRGHLGGLSLAAPEAVRVLDAVGFSFVIVETVGVGQVEVEVAAETDTTVVVINPGWGDAVQANKAGLLEVADVFCVNKADRPGAAEAGRDLGQMLDMTGARDWRPPVIDTVATDGTGVADLWAAILAHQAAQTASGSLAAERADRVRVELSRVLARRLLEQAEARTQGEGFDAVCAQVVAGEIDPWEAADRLLAD
ncbi:MAG: methylmalonyl Co-A mutase-associated GTPase MeaB [Acidimicrobiales bacterium]